MASFGATLRQGLRGTERRRIRRRDRQSDTNLEMVLNQLSAKGGGGGVHAAVIGELIRRLTAFPCPCMKAGE